MSLDCFFHSIGIDDDIFNSGKERLELEEIYDIQAQGAYVRARAKMKTEGEKPTRLFCSLEKFHSNQKHIPKLQVEKDGGIENTSDQKEIELENNSQMVTITMASSTVILLPFSQVSDNSSTSPFFRAYRTLSEKKIFCSI